MSLLSRFTATLVAVLLSTAIAPAATQRQVDAAVEKGTSFLKSQGKSGTFPEGGSHGIGPTALAGLALLEAKVPASDPVIQAIARTVRDASYRETKTYQLSLCLLFLDKLEDPADVPLIQVLAVRLLAGQTAQGGWSYDCIEAVPQAEERILRGGLKVEKLVAGNKVGEDTPETKGKRVGRLHPEVEQYAARLWAKRQVKAGGDDNSNTQFAVLAVWASRKHGVPVEASLDAIEKRFIVSQDRQTGGWSYTGGAMDGGSSPAMTCAGLIGLSVGLARREEQRMKSESTRKEKSDDPKVNDPFFNPPSRPNEPKAKKAAKRPVDPRNIPIQRGLHGLGGMFISHLRGGDGNTGQDLYFLWSLERVGVIYGIEKIGGLDWYAVGSDILVKNQAQSGAWSGGYSETIDTSFAILFLVRSNVARDLSSRIQKDPSNTELRSGPASGAVEPAPEPSPMPSPGGNVGSAPAKPLPLPIQDESGKLASQLIKASGDDWTETLELLRDSKGGEHTRALTVAISRLDGDRKSQTRNALAERLTRMTGSTLRGMMKSEDAELRRGAVLASAMKDDRTQVPDLIDRLTDEEDLVVRAAAAGLKSLSRGKDFGPEPGATKQQKQAAADAWRAWWRMQK